MQALRLHSHFLTIPYDLCQVCKHSPHIVKQLKSKHAALLEIAIRSERYRMLASGPVGKGRRSSGLSMLGAVVSGLTGKLVGATKPKRSFWKL